MPSRVIASVANYFIPMKTKTPSLALLIAAGLLSSTASASAYITYGPTVVNGVTYNLSPGATLTGAHLENATLTGANLYGAYLVNAHLNYADLTGANLNSAWLSGAWLNNATLTGADLTGAALTGATVSYSNWTDFSTNSGALGLDDYGYNTSAIKYVGRTIVPEPSTYGLIGIGALGVAFAARRRKLKTA